MLSGHLTAQFQIDMIKTGRNYNVHALPAGGCKRLGVPPVLFTDGPRGVVMLNSTCFPSAVARASSFDPDMEYRVGKVIADEAIAQGANLFAGVCINVARNPRWGRTQESYGEIGLPGSLASRKGKTSSASAEVGAILKYLLHIRKDCFPYKSLFFALQKHWITFNVSKRQEKDGEDWHLVDEDAHKCRHHRPEIKGNSNKSSILST